MSADALEREAVKKAIERVIDTKSYYPMQGNPSVKGFEQELSRRLGNVPVLGMESGTSALINALKLLNIGPGDEVIVPAFSFIATAAPVSWVGATPVFADIRENDYSLDPNSLEGKITDKTKAIIVAHLFGRPAGGIATILEKAKKHSIPIIEDVAQSFGAKIRIDGEYRQAGTFGDLSCFSFSSTKPFSAPGNAGAIAFPRQQALYETALMMRSYGEKTLHYDHPVIGVNNVLQDVQAAALLAKFRFLEYWLEHRRRLAKYYSEHLRDIPEISLPDCPDDIEHTWYRYTIRTEKRDALFKHLSSAAGKFRRLRPVICYPVPLPFFSAFRQQSLPGTFPVSEKVSKEVIPLPLYNLNSIEDAMLITETVKRFFGKN